MSQSRRTLLEVRPDDSLNTGEAHEEIRRAIHSLKPFLVTRFGSTELKALARSARRKEGSPRSRLLNSVFHLEAPFWAPWEHHDLAKKSGFFPVTKEATEAYFGMLIDAMEQIDLLGSWVDGESLFRNELAHCKVTSLSNLSPFSWTPSWVGALKGKKVLVIHPFEDTINAQYQRHLSGKKISPFIPDFELLTVRAEQTLGGASPNGLTWFAGLSRMEESALEHDFDVAILGCGAYGFPLAARLKIAGKPVINLGGETQLLFGIKGKRWDDSELYNEFWVRPSEHEKPPQYRGADGGAYW